MNDYGIIQIDKYKHALDVKAQSENNGGYIALQRKWVSLVI